MQRATGYRLQVSGFAPLVLALMLACACFGCAGEQTGNASSEKEGVEVEATHDPSVQASTSAGAAGNVDHYRADCRMQTYIFKENMSKAEAKDVTARVAYQVQANLNGGGDKNLGDILDDLDVPAYDFLCG